MTRVPVYYIRHFLDYRVQGWGVFLLAFVFIYGNAYLMAWCLSEWNRKPSWRWVRNVFRSKVTLRSQRVI